MVTVSKNGYVIGGSIYPRVTSILGVIAKPALTGWAAKMVAEFAVEHKQRWVGLPDRDAVNLLKGAPWSKRDAAGDRGSAVHHAIEAYLKGTGDYPTFSGDERQVARHAIRFLQAHKPEPIGVEVTVYSPSMVYAGTCDLPCRIGGEVWLLDWKTSSGVYADYALQLYAYSIAERAILGEEDVVCPWLGAEPRLGIIHLTPKGAQMHEVTMDRTELDAAWRAALALYRWKEREEDTLTIRASALQLAAS